MVITMAANDALGTVSKLIFLIYCCCCFIGAQPYPYGVVKPGDPFKFIGETLELYCNITDTNIQENSSMLYFERSTSTESENLIPRHFIEILTTKSIRLRIPNLRISDDGVYTCLQRKFDNKTRIIGHQIVQVDYKPRKIENINCRVYNWLKMKCDWDLGVNYTHPEHINVSVVWTIDKQQYDCPNQTPTSCLWKKSLYQHGHQYYMAVIVKTIHKNEVLAEATSKTFKIETDYYEPSEVVSTAATPNYEVVSARIEPAPVNTLMAVVENSTCVSLTWQHPSDKAREKFFVAEYRSSLEEKWRNVVLNQTHDRSLVCNLTPFTQYEFRMAVLPYPISTDKHVYQGYKSDWKTVLATTSEDAPGAPPKTCPSCYYELKRPPGEFSRKIKIYWQDLLETEKHGRITNYVINHTTVGSGEIFHMELPIDGSEALTSADLNLTNLALDYKLTLNIATSVGASASASSLYIPALVNKPQPPQSFLVETDGKYEESTFFLSWAATNLDRSSRMKYTNITIVWCLKKVDFECKDEIHWITLPPDQVTYELKPGIKDKNPDSFLIGISAETIRNGKKFASGIHWSSCKYLLNHEPQSAPRNVRFSPNHPDNGLTILWNKFTCADRAFVTEYLVKYCPAAEGKTCKERPKFKSVKNTVSEVTLKELTPESRYIVSVSALSSAGSGPESEAIASVVKGSPPEQDEGEAIGAIIGITVAVAVIIILLLWFVWYCRQRKSKTPVTEDMIDPYEVIEPNEKPQKYSCKKPQDFRNRPLPKTPSEEQQHFYGSSARMNNHGSDKVPNKGHSESSSEDSITSQTKLISKNGYHPNCSVGSSHPEDGREPYSKLKDFGYSGSRDKNSSEKETQALLGEKQLEKDFIDGPKRSTIKASGKQTDADFVKPSKCDSNSSMTPQSDTTSSSITPEDYMRLGLESSSGSNSAGSDKGIPKKMQKNEKNVPNISDISNASTLPLRAARDVIAFPVWNASSGTFNPLETSLCGGHGSANDIVPEKVDKKIRPKNPNYVRRYRPSMCEATTPLPIDGSQPSTVQTPLMNGYVSNIPNNTQFIDDVQVSKPTSNTGYVSNLSYFAPERTDDSINTGIPAQNLPPNGTVVPQRDKRRSVPLETVLKFPPPPSSPPPSPSTDDVQHTLNKFSSPLSLSHLPDDSNNSSSIVPSINVPLETKLISPVHTSGYVTHNALPSESAYFSRHPHDVRTIQNSENNIPAHSDYQFHCGNTSMLSAGIVPRAGNKKQTYGPNVAYLPVPASPMSRPLSGDLLELPPKFYEDPKLGGSNQILTEL